VLSRPRAVGWPGGCRPRRVRGCDHEGGLSGCRMACPPGERAGWATLEPWCREVGRGSSGWLIGRPGYRYRVSGWGGRRRSRAPAARPIGGWRSSSPLPSGGAGTQALEPFAAGPGDRLLQLPPVDGISRAGGGASHGCRTRHGQVAWALLIWCGKVSGHGGLLGGLAGLADCLPGIQVAGSTLDSGGGGHQAQPPTRQPTRWLTRIRHARRSGDSCAASARALADCSWHHRPWAPIGPRRSATKLQTEAYVWWQDMPGVAAPAYCWARTDSARRR
jgi:hypothetical protein